MLIWVLEGVEVIFDELGYLTSGDAGWFVFVSVPVGLLAAWCIARRFAD